MKQKKLSCLFAIVPVLLLVSCHQMEEDAPGTQEKHIITAYLESEPDTKTYLSEPDSKGIYYPYWSAKDAIAVYADGINQPDRYTLVSGEGSAKGSFSGLLRGQRLVGLYPYSARTKQGLQGTVLTLELPSEQSYAVGTFGEGAFPMVAVSDDGALTFKNLCSVLRITMTGKMAVQSITFSAHDTWMPVSGKASVNMNYSSQPELVMADEGSPEVTLQCGFVELDPTTPKDFFLVIPPGTYRGGFSVKIKTFNGTVTRSTTSDITFKRSQVRSIPAFECAADGEIDPDDIPHNEIWYFSDYQVYERSDAFDQEMVSHTFEKGKGVMRFAAPVTSLGSYPFRYESTLTRIHLPNCVKSIGTGAFAYTQLSSFRTPDQLERFGYNVFMDCENLSSFSGKFASADGKSIVLGNGDMVAYARGVPETQVQIPEGVKSLSAYLFYGNQIIRDVTVPEGVESIGAFCFAECTSLESICLPSSLQSLGDYIFEGCTHLREFSGDSEFVLDSHSLVYKGSLLVYAGSGVENYVIPEGVAEIGTGVIRGRPELKSLTIPSSLNNLYNGWVSNCDNLEFFYGPGVTEDHHLLVFYGEYLVGATSICPADYVLPRDAGIKRIFNQVFEGNPSIEKLTIPDEVYYIGFRALSNMPKLKTLVLPASLTTLFSGMFIGDTALETVYLRSYTPPSYSENDSDFAGHEGFVMYVPEGTEEMYKSAPGWSNYADYIQGYKYDDLEKPDYYISTDFSHDGEVKVLQTATEGNGINLVLMGDAYSDRQIADGTYDAAMNKMMEAFFSEEPYTTLRSLFNVSSVTVVSSTEGYDHGGQALSTWFGDGTLVGGNDARCMEYARKVVPEDEMDHTLIIVAMNRDYYAGTCYMYYPSVGDYGDGLSIAYFPASSDTDTFNGLVRHEAGGHGFAKLADEYAYENMGTIPQGEIDTRNQNVPYGWWKNADFTDDHATVKWAHFLSDSRYQYDGLGCFEGAFTYWRGAWRPTENSIMRHNTDGFNAPSREAIWYRAHKLAYGEQWQYRYEDFAAYDVKNRKTSAGAVKRAKAVERRMAPLHEPVVIPRRWNDPVPAAKKKNSPGLPVVEPEGPVSTNMPVHVR